MCNIDYDPPSVSVTTNPTARKPHACAECRREIAPGETYRRNFGVWEGAANTFKTCAHCCVGQDWLLSNCDGFMHSQLLDEVHEHAEEYPKIRLGMFRLEVGIRRKWTRFDGAGLLPVPPMPRPIDAQYL